MKSALIKKVKLKECTDKIVTCNPQNVFKESNFSYLDIASVSNISKRITNVGSLKGVEAPSRARQLVKEGDILISTVRPNLNAVAKVTSKYEGAIASTGFCVLRPQKEKLLSTFLYYWVTSPSFVEDMVKKATGASYPAVSDSIIKDSEIPLPPLHIQQQIAAILDKADALRQKDQQLLQQYDALAQSIFYDMFGDPVKNEKGWEVKKLGDLCTIKRGASPRPIDSFIGDDVHWIKIGDGTGEDDMYITDTKVKITKQGSTKSVLLNPGDLIFANCGVSLGFARILKISGCIHDGWLSFQMNNDSIISSIYLLKLINTITYYLRSLAPEGTQPNLNTGIMKDIDIIVPPIKLQNAFVETIGKLSQLKAVLLKNAIKSDLLYNSFLNCYFK